ncbi:hypothetical protein [Streptomyces niveus]|uniref:hypothetical protein n=1 Tax=Streptomyces niveus TaxID=193462 RepID=UPI003431F64F
MRLARPEDGERFGELLALATEAIEQPYIDGVTSGRCGKWRLDGLSKGGEAPTELTGRPIALGAGPGEQLFFRWK